jgi:prolyl-tRNA synthetase
VAPFAAQLVSLPLAEAAAESLYQRLRGAGVDVLWDDRTESVGVKFGDADLIGNPVRLVMSRRTGDKIEWKARVAEQGELVEVEEAVERLRLD